VGFTSSSPNSDGNLEGDQMTRSRKWMGWSLHPLMQVLLYFTFALFITFLALMTWGDEQSEEVAMLLCFAVILSLATRTMQHDHDAELTELRHALTAQPVEPRLQG
jgi:L-asparagine transporter-like permease